MDRVFNNGPTNPGKELRSLYLGLVGTEKVVFRSSSITVGQLSY